MRFADHPCGAVALGRLAGVERNSEAGIAVGMRSFSRRTPESDGRFASYRRVERSGADSTRVRRWRLLMLPQT